MPGITDLHVILSQQRAPKQTALELQIQLAGEEVNNMFCHEILSQQTCVSLREPDPALDLSSKHSGWSHEAVRNTHTLFFFFF